MGRTFNELMNSETYAQCYIFEKDEKRAGYALLAKTFSQEAGGRSYGLTKSLFCRNSDARD